jgi:hypothetical protein
MKNHILIIFTVLLLAGCATSYHRMGFTGGYTDEATGKNTFDVSFYGNGSSYTDRVSDFAMLRAAEITLQNGYSFFTVEDKKELLEVSSPFPKPVVRIKILCFVDRPSGGNSYEANVILSSLKQKYGLSK